MKKKCVACLGSSICQHKQRRETCVQCRGSQICAHDRRRGRCLDCGGFAVLARLLYTSARARAKFLNLPFEISESDILALIGKGVCPVLGFRFEMGKGGPKNETATLDRDATAEQVKKVAEWMASK